MIEHKRQEIDTLKPFRLVKFFSFTALGVILISTLFLSWITSNYAKKVLLERSEAYSLLLAENLNRQVFQQFVLPTALRYGGIALSNPVQFKRLDTVVKNNTEGLKVDSVTIFDSEENIISYSTSEEIVGKKDVGGPEYRKALLGFSSTVLHSSGNLKNLLPTAAPISCKLTTYIPFRRENPLNEQTQDIMGVTEIVQDLSDDLEAIIRLQAKIIIASILIMGALFTVLRFIVAKADRIIEARALERRRLEEKLNQAERLASLGKMVAAVSHEIKNPLGIVRSTAEILSKRVKNLAPGNEHLAEIIIAETSRLDGIVMEFLDFARPQEPKLSPGSVCEILNKVIGFIRPELDKYNITLEAELDAALPEVEMDGNLLYRCFLNLIVNAIQAMPDGGTLSISAFVSPENANEVQVMINDTGIGMPEEKTQLIFNPFYTDKIRGTGLGLAIAKNIVDGHHGSITVASVEGAGSTFTISLKANS